MERRCSSRSTHRDDRRRHRRSPPPSSSSRRRRSRSNDRDRDRDNKEDVERLNPPPSKVLGVFGLSSQTDERGLKRVFSKFGRVTNVHIVYDRGVKRSWIIEKNTSGGNFLLLILRLVDRVVLVSSISTN